MGRRAWVHLHEINATVGRKGERVFDRHDTEELALDIDHANRDHILDLAIRPNREPSILPRHRRQFSHARNPPETGQEWHASSAASPFQCEDSAHQGHRRPSIQGASRIGYADRCRLALATRERPGSLAHEGVGHEGGLNGASVVVIRASEKARGSSLRWEGEGEAPCERCRSSSRTPSSSRAATRRRSTAPGAATSAERLSGGRRSRGPRFRRRRRGGGRGRRGFRGRCGRWRGGVRGRSS